MPQEVHGDLGEEAAGHGGEHGDPPEGGRGGQRHHQGRRRRGQRGRHRRAGRERQGAGDPRPGRQAQGQCHAVLGDAPTHLVDLVPVVVIVLDGGVQVVSAQGRKEGKPLPRLHVVLGVSVDTRKLWKSQQVQRQGGVVDD